MLGLLAVLAVVSLAAGCVMEDPYPRDRLIERFEQQKALRDRLVNYLTSLESVAEADVVFGQDQSGGQSTGRRQVVLIITPAEGQYTPADEGAMVAEAARICGCSSRDIKVFRSRH